MSTLLFLCFYSKARALCRARSSLVDAHAIAFQAVEPVVIVPVRVLVLVPVVVVEIVEVVVVGNDVKPFIIIFTHRRRATFERC